MISTMKMDQTNHEQLYNALENLRKHSTRKISMDEDRMYVVARANGEVIGRFLTYREACKAR